MRPYARGLGHALTTPAAVGHQGHVLWSISWLQHSYLLSVMAYTLWNVLLSESEQIYLLSIVVSLTEFFVMRHQDIKNLGFIRS